MRSFQMLMASLVVLPLSLTSIGCGPDVTDIEAKIGERAMNVETFSAQLTPSETGALQLLLKASEVLACGPNGDETILLATIHFNGFLADMPLEEPIAVDTEDQKSKVFVDVEVINGICAPTRGKAARVSGTVTFTELTETNAEGSIDLQLDGVESECAALSSIMSITYKWSSFMAPSYNGEGCG